MNPPKPKHKTARNIVVTVLILTCIVIGYSAYQATKPYPLDDALHYIGKDDYGCWIPYCDSMPNSVYFYETDLSIGEAVRHFKKATVVDGEDIASMNDPSVPRDFSMKTKDGRTFYVDYYINGIKYADGLNIRAKRPHVITLLKGQYQAAKDSL